MNSSQFQRMHNILECGNGEKECVWARVRDEAHDNFVCVLHDKNEPILLPPFFLMFSHIFDDVDCDDQLCWRIMPLHTHTRTHEISIDFPCAFCGTDDRDEVHRGVYTLSIYSRALHNIWTRCSSTSSFSTPSLCGFAACLYYMCHAPCVWCLCHDLMLSIVFKTLCVNVIHAIWHFELLLPTYPSDMHRKYKYYFEWHIHCAAALLPHFKLLCLAF